MEGWSDNHKKSVVNVYDIYLVTPNESLQSDIIFLQAI
jgi:hypothetical protein